MNHQQVVLLGVASVQVGVGVGDDESFLEDVKVVGGCVGLTAGRELHLCKKLLCLGSSNHH